jgi:hypothetical protein
MAFGAAGLDATTDGMDVLMPGMSQRGGQRAGEIMEGDLEAVDFFKGLDGTFRRVEMSHGEGKIAGIAEKVNLSAEGAEPAFRTED